MKKTYDLSFGTDGKVRVFGAGFFENVNRLSLCGEPQPLESIRVGDIVYRYRAGFFNAPGARGENARAWLARQRA